MLLSADWLVPVSRRPERQGALRIHNGKIAEVGSADELARRHPHEEVREFEGCAIMPGLVNAHTHLALTAMEGLIPPMSFEAWIPALVAGMRAWTPDDFAASTTLGVARCLEAGVTVVGDVVYGPESAGAAADGGLGGVFYWEVLGIGPHELPARLAELEFPERGQWRGERVRFGLSPHSLYTSGPDLLRAMRDYTAAWRLPFAIHAGESAAEVELVRNGSGPLAGIASRTAHGFRPGAAGPIDYLDGLGVLDDATAIHVCQTFPSDVPRLAATLRGAVTCPRSNAYLSTGSAPVRQLLGAGVPVGLGTDSAASNVDLDLMAEGRALRQLMPSLPASTVIAMATLLGARAVGLDEQFGSLTPGKQADVAIFRLDSPGEEPEERLVASAGPDSLEALMSAGTWRVLEGGLVEPRGNESAVAPARKRAKAAIAASLGAT